MDFSQRLDSVYRRRFCTVEAYVRTVRRWRFAFRQLSEADVEDGIQAAFESVYGNYLNTGREPQTDEALEALINRAIRNKLIDKVRSAARAPIDRLTEEPEEGAADLDAIFGVSVPVETELAVKQLLLKIYDRLDEKMQRVLKMMLVGCTPEEIGEAFGQNGYVLRRWGRNRICRILLDLSAQGEPLASVFHGRCCI